MSSEPATTGVSTRELLRGVHVVPSILSADFGRLRAQVEEVLAAGARIVQVDVMDGHFVPPITVGPLVVEALRDHVTAAGGILDVHLMIERPERQVEAFASAGAHSITVHAEATPHVLYALDQVRAAGCAAGVAINPGTPVQAVAEVLDAVDMVLCMTVNPGWGGQAFIPHSLQKIRHLRELVGDEIAVQVDGGVDVQTAPGCREGGANLFVAGSAVFGADDPGGAFRAISRAVGAP